MEDIRDALVLAALNHVLFDGWSEAALRRAAVDCGFDEDMARIAFVGGAGEAVDHFLHLADAMMEEDFRDYTRDQTLRAQERLHTALALWLRRWNTHKEAVRRALTAVLLTRGPLGPGKVAWRTADAAWKVIGDEAADFSWYTKRVSLAAVWTATLLSWFEDRDPTGAATEDFLNRRLSEVVVAIKARRKMTDTLRAAVSSCKSPGSLFERRELFSSLRRTKRR